MDETPTSPGTRLFTKRPWLSTNIDKCLVCQADITGKRLQVGSQPSVQKLIESAKVRRDEVYMRLETEIEEHGFEDKIVRWHKNCYASYTCTKTVALLKKDDEQPSTSAHTEVPTLRSSETVTNWNLCFVCQQTKCKGERELSQVVTTQVYEKVMSSAECRNDSITRRRVTGEDLIAIEAKYHKGCYKRYTMLKADPLHEQSNPDMYEQAFQELLKQVDYKLVKGGRAYEMSTLLDMFKGIMRTLGIDEELCERYQVRSLKSRLPNRYGTEISFHQFHRNKPEIVCSSSINLAAMINAIADMNEIDRFSSTDHGPEGRPEEVMQVLYHAAVALRADMKDIDGIQTKPLNLADLSIEKANEIVPKNLRAFVCFLIQSERSLKKNISERELEDLLHESNKPRLQQQILAICQDIMFANSSGKKKMPKHVGLGLTVKTLVRSKEIVTLLNQHGHCVNYWDCEEIDTCWASDIMERYQASDGYYKALIPSNIIPGTFVQCAADNTDYMQDTATGKDSVHVMSMAFYQNGHPVPLSDLVPPRPPTKEDIKRRSLQMKPVQMYEFVRPAVCKPGFIRTVTLEMFRESFQERDSCHGLDMAWILARNTATKLLQVEMEPNRQAIPGWSGFHSIVTSHVSQPTRIGFPPMIPASAKDPETIYTCLKSLDKVFRSNLHQRNPVITFDEDLYAEAKKIQWATRPEFDHVVFRLGGFHRAKNFAAVIGKRMAESGLEDLWVEGGVFGPNVAAKIMNGSHYNRTIRAHKLTLEVLERLRWEEFEKWLSQHETEAGLNLDAAKKAKEHVVAEFEKGSEHVLCHRSEVRRSVWNLEEQLKLCEATHERFLKDGCKKSITFKFWNEYIELVWLLLDFIHADRDSNWDLHLECMTGMVPLDRAFDHLDYFRWGVIYIADMKMLPQTAPDVHEAFVHVFTRKRLHAVSRMSTESSFNAVSPDMALEQTANTESKTKGGILGSSGIDEVRDRWAMTAHLRAGAVQALKEMSGQSVNEARHKDLERSSIARDESDIRKLTDCLNEKMTNPFDLTDYDGEVLPLVNIATGAIAPPDTTDSLLSAKTVGDTLARTFINDRCVESKEEFYAPLKKANVKTFASMNKPLKLSKAKQFFKVINIDRQIFSRLLVVSENRDVDLREVLSYELSPVPLSLVNMDGTLRKTQKSLLLKELEMETLARDKIPRTDQTIAAAYFIDLLAVIQMMPKEVHIRRPFRCYIAQCHA